MVIYSLRMKTSSSRWTGTTYRESLHNCPILISRHGGCVGRLIRERFALLPASADHNAIWEASSDGDQVHDLLSGWHEATDPLQGSWTPDGKYYVFQASHGVRSDIWAIREAADRFHKVNRQPIQLTAGPLSFYSPQPSIDGKRLFAIGVQLRAELVRYDAKSAQFVPYLGGSSDYASELFQGWAVGDLLVLSGTRSLAQSRRRHRKAATHPCPHGRMGANNLVRRQADPIQCVWSWGRAGDVPGFDRRRFAPASCRKARGVWCGQSNSMVFVDGPAQNSKVRLFDIKTSEMTIVPGSDGLRLPRCSPDGRYITAVTQDGKKLRLYELATGNWSDLATRDIGFLQWSSDNKYVYFDTGTSKELAVYRVRISDRKLEKVADLQNFRRSVDPWVSWMGLTPDGSPLLTRDIGSQEVYALDFEAP